MVFNTNLAGKDAARVIARRAVALAWVTNPLFFEGKSLSQLAAELGLPKQVLSRCSAAASRKFGIQNRGQAHAGNRGLKRSRNAQKRSSPTNCESANLNAPDKRSSLPDSPEARATPN